MQNKIGMQLPHKRTGIDRGTEASLAGSCAVDSDEKCCFPPFPVVGVFTEKMVLVVKCREIAGLDAEQYKWCGLGQGFPEIPSIKGKEFFPLSEKKLLGRILGQRESCIVGTTSGYLPMGSAGAVTLRFENGAFCSQVTAQNFGTLDEVGPHGITRLFGICPAGRDSTWTAQTFSSGILVTGSWALLVTWLEGASLKW